MKKIITIVLLFTAIIPIFGQRSYVFMKIDKTFATISGDTPRGINTTYHHSEIGEVLNKLSNHGFQIERMVPVGTDEFQLAILMSKDTSPNSVKGIISEGNEDVYEIARYNLQGIPVKEKEKGIQIIVFSDYSTKTIFVN